MTNIKHRLTPHPVKIRAGNDKFYLALTLMIPGSFLCFSVDEALFCNFKIL